MFYHDTSKHCPTSFCFNVPWILAIMGELVFSIHHHHHNHPVTKANNIHGMSFSVPFVGGMELTIGTIPLLRIQRIIRNYGRSFPNKNHGRIPTTTTTTTLTLTTTTITVNLYPVGRHKGNLERLCNWHFEWHRSRCNDMRSKPIHM